MAPGHCKVCRWGEVCEKRCSTQQGCYLEVCREIKAKCCALRLDLRVGGRVALCQPIPAEGCGGGGTGRGHLLITPLLSHCAMQ